MILLSAYELRFPALYKPQAASTNLTRTRRASPSEMAAAVAVTRRINASLHVEATGNGAADGESRRDSAAAYSPAAKRINDAKDSDVWVAVQEGDMPGDSTQALLFRTMKIKGSILHPYRLIWSSIVDCL